MLTDRLGPAGEHVAAAQTPHHSCLPAGASPSDACAQEVAASLGYNNYGLRALAQRVLGAQMPKATAVRSSLVPLAFLTQCDPVSCPNALRFSGAFARFL